MKNQIAIIPRTSGDVKGVVLLNMDYKIEEVALSLKFVLEVLRMSEADQEIPVCFKNQQGKILFSHQISFSPYVTEAIKNLEMAKETACDYVSKLRKVDCVDPELNIVEKSTKDSSVLEETQVNEMIMIHSKRKVMLEGMIDILERNIHKIPALGTLANIDLYLTKREFINHVSISLVTAQIMLALNNLKLEMKKNCND